MTRTTRGRSEVSAERLEAIRRRLSSATPGPWEQGHHWDASEWIKGGFGGRKFRPASDTSYEWTPTAADAEFIANAPEDIDFLLELVMDLIGARK